MLTKAFSPFAAHAHVIVSHRLEGIFEEDTGPHKGHFGTKMRQFWGDFGPFTVDPGSFWAIFQATLAN